MSRRPPWQQACDPRPRRLKRPRKAGRGSLVAALLVFGLVAGGDLVDAAHRLGIASPDRSKEWYFPGCNEARAAGLAPIYRNEPGYREAMDGDGDGIACEPYYTR